MLKQAKGFTLIELLLIIVVVAIAATLLIGAVRNTSIFSSSKPIFPLTHTGSVSAPLIFHEASKHQSLGTHRMEVRIDGVVILDTILK